MQQAEREEWVKRGYLEDAQQRLVPIKNVRQVDLERDRVVRELAQAAEELSQKLAAYKEASLKAVDGFVERVAQEYKTSMVGAKGHLTLNSYDGAFRIQVSMGERLEFNEGLTVARKLIGSCLRRWAKTASTNTKTIVEHAFQMDKKGRIDARRILSLRQLQIDDEEWQRAMQSISDSVRVVQSKRYFRVQRRNADGAYETISLSLGAAQ